uniref:leucine aminopeptidase 1-like n=1 Tax=Erigeron canadensis TaxID=72917 RepID=UPI001CB90F55|nr:leucine aminopeptidase 1-like [Erigeron canadensis]
MASAAAAIIKIAAHSSSSSSFALFTSSSILLRSTCFSITNTKTYQNNLLSCGFSRNKRMAHVISKATLGLTLPAQIDHPKISFSAKETDLVEWKGDILAVGVTEKDMLKDENSKFQNPILKKLDSQLGGLLSEVSVEEDFTGKTGQSTVIRLAGLGSKRVSLIGLGKGSTGSSTVAYHSLGESVASAAKASQANNVAIALASLEGLTYESKIAIASALAKGTLLGTYEDNRFKSESKKSALKSVELLGLGTGPELEKKLKYTEDVCSGVILAKELVNAPANVLTPEVLAAEAEKIAATYSDVLTAKILDTEQCKELKMGSYLGVAAASTNPPKFIHLCYKPPSGSVKTKLALVGKGLTFDSGGYNIKTGPGCSIEMMKVDMGGSSAVLGAAKALGQIKPPGVEVHFIVAACENMISGTGMRPGDILTASNGKTIEVNNTDAEGRLTLADALVYACNQGVDKIVDLATLTGACIVALGPSVAGIFTPSDELSKEVVAASEVAGEKLWRMPMEESYWEQMKSGVADMVNTGGRQGGSITAALFLKQFVDEKVQWLHIDMAGPVWSDKKKAATGFAISTLVEWVVFNSSS